MKTPKDLSNYTYYGRGPQNNYNDRKNGAFVELYHINILYISSALVCPADDLGSTSLSVAGIRRKLPASGYEGYWSGW